MRLRIAPLALAAALASFSALGGETPSYSLEIHSHAFAPATVEVPAGVRVKLLVKNQRRLPSEFESFDLNREKVVPPGATISVWIGPLNPGKYKFFDDFNPGVTGWIVAGKPDGGEQP